MKGGRKWKEARGKQVIYDSLRIVIPKGRKKAVETHAAAKGEICQRISKRPSEGRYGALRSRLKKDNQGLSY